jgi:hypothetical protein
MTFSRKKYELRQPRPEQPTQQQQPPTLRAHKNQQRQKRQSTMATFHEAN